MTTALTSSQKVLRLVWCHAEIDRIITKFPQCPRPASIRVDRLLVEAEQFTHEVLG